MGTLRSHARAAVVAGLATLAGCLTMAAPAPPIGAGEPGPVRLVTDVAPGAVHDPSLPAEVETPLRRAWRYLVLHHSATAVGGAARFDRFHRDEKKFDRGLGYHFVIGNGTDTADGAIEVGPRWAMQEPGAHAGVTAYNEAGIGICLVGDFSLRPPSPGQLDALRRLVAVLRRRCDIPAERIVAHRDFREGTVCPGDAFPMNAVRGE